MSEFVMTVGGEPTSTSETFGVTNPATGQVFAQAPKCSRGDLDAAFELAAQAYRDWRFDETRRRKSLLAIAEILVSAAGELAPLLTREQGKPVAEARGEIFAAAAWCRYYAGLVAEPQIVQDDADALVEAVRRPLGVVVAITPWNVPVVLSFTKIAPALLAGNTVVVKPSPFTPLTTLKAVQLIQEVLPPGVVSAVSGDDELGSWMTKHPVPRKVSFTGSVATGKKVAAATAADLKRVTLELGGNDPAIVLEDADPEIAARGIFAAAFSNNGQVCCGIKRVYVPQSLHDDVVDALVAHATSIKVGDPTEPDTKLGPINNAPQYNRVKELVSNAISRGGCAAAGGRPMDRPGYFYEPTILTGVSDGFRVVDEEQFGPALPVISYRDLAHALAAANDTHYGLAGSVWSTDPDRAVEVAGELECGTAWINTHLALAPHVPFGGVKWSGIGTENGAWGLEEFTEMQSVYRSRRTDGLSFITAQLVS